MTTLILSLIGLQLFTNISVDAQGIDGAKPVVSSVFVILTFLVSFIYQMRTTDFSDKCGMFIFTLLMTSGFLTIIPRVVHIVYCFFTRVISLCGNTKK